MTIQRKLVLIPGIVWFCLFAALLLTGCANRPINEPIEQANPQTDYRPHLLLPKRQNNDQQTLFVLSFSGGGTRAAADSNARGSYAIATNSSAVLNGGSEFAPNSPRLCCKR